MFLPTLTHQTYLPTHPIPPCLVKLSTIYFSKSFPAPIHPARPRPTVSKGFLTSSTVTTTIFFSLPRLATCSLLHKDQWTRQGIGRDRARTGRRRGEDETETGTGRGLDGDVAMTEQWPFGEEAALRRLTVRPLGMNCFGAPSIPLLSVRRHAGSLCLCTPTKRTFLRGCVCFSLSLFLFLFFFSLFLCMCTLCCN